MNIMELIGNQGNELIFDQHVAGGGVETVQYPLGVKIRVPGEGPLPLILSILLYFPIFYRVSQ